MSSDILQIYIQKIERLRRYRRSDGEYAPYKPCLLLGVIELIANGDIPENKILLSDSLIATFTKYVAQVPGWNSGINNPFFYLRTDGFWHLQPNAGHEVALNAIRTTPSIRWLLEVVAYVHLDEPFFILLADPQSRSAIRQAIIDTYFPEIRENIENLIGESQQIGEYRQLLIREGMEHPFSYQIAAEPFAPENPLRSAAFRREIMRLYDYTCAVCRLRIVTTTGESATDAAHIIPFHLSYNDDIRNGISLCKLHHWAFDQGLISLSNTYTIIISSLMSDLRPTEWMLPEQRDTSIVLPEQNQLHPAQDALEWHREQVLRR